MKIWRDRNKKWITTKEFFSRWKKGMVESTPLQQTKLQCKFTWIMLVGIILGLVISLYSFKNLWWVSIILFGVAGNTSIQLVTIYQKRKLLENIEKQLKELEEPEKIKGYSNNILNNLEENPAIEEKPKEVKEEPKEIIFSAFPNKEIEKPKEIFNELAEHHKENDKEGRFSGLTEHFKENLI